MISHRERTTTPEYTQRVKGLVWELLTLRLFQNVLTQCFLQWLAQRFSDVCYVGDTR